MAMLDVSEALTNPYTLDTFAVNRRQQTIDGYGQAQISTQIIAGVRGVVFPEGLNDLSRRPEAQTNAKSIVVITRFQLRGESETVDKVQFQPDVIVWNDDSFLVVRVEDWSQYARGFLKCTAQSVDIVDAPPNVT
jgi:hypothetical protein